MVHVPCVASNNGTLTKPNQTTMKTALIALALVALLALAIAITSGKFGGPSDLEMRIRASEPVRLQK
jgi:hypothetical protein